MKLVNPSVHLAVLCAVLLLAGCQKGTVAAPHEPPAKVATIANEEKLNTLVLTADAERRLGITTAAVAMKSIERLRSFGGEVVAPPGALIVVSAPVAGTLQAAGSESVPPAGALVSHKQPLFVLLPLLSPERDVLTPAERIRYAESKNAIATAKVDADNQVQQAEVQLEANRIALDRATRLLRDAAGAARTVDEAQAQFDLGTKSLQAARSRKKLLDSIDLEAEAGQATPLPIEAPQEGMIRAQHAAVGEVVSAGEPLVEVLRFDPLWVRVPVYAGELPQLAVDEAARIGDLHDTLGAKSIEAKAIAAPPTAVALSSTVDLYFELENPNASWRPGQRVAARLKQRDKTEQKVVPWSAVMHDIHGGTWVYENTAPQTYVRRRVDVRYVVDSLAVLQEGPAIGAKVVTTAVVELFGTEFGFAK